MWIKGNGMLIRLSVHTDRIKRFDQFMTVMERVHPETGRDRIVLIDEMQFGSRPGRGTTDAIFGS